MSGMDTLRQLGHIDTYQVGLRRDLNRAWTAARLGDWGCVRSRIRWIRSGWRRRSYYNGWLAEPYHLPLGMTRVGRGWTRVGALRSLARRARKEAHIDTEASR